MLLKVLGTGSDPDGLERHLGRSRGAVREDVQESGSRRSDELTATGWTLRDG